MDPLSRNQDIQRSRTMAGARSQSYRAGSTQARMAQPGYRDSVSAAQGSTMAREITPVSEPTEDFTPMSADARKSSNKQRNNAGIILGALIVVIILCVGTVVGLCLVNKNKPKTAVTPTPTSTNSRSLTSTEVSDLSAKVSYLVMAESVQDYTALDRYRLFARIAENRLTDVDRLEIAIRSLRSEYVVDGINSIISVSRVADRYQEIFGAELKQAESAYCPSFILSPDSLNYIISGECNNVDLSVADLIYKENYRYENGYAYVDLLVGSMVRGAEENPQSSIIYTDYYESNAKVSYRTMADFATPEEFNAFRITSENGNAFASYSLRFATGNDGKFYYLGATNNNQAEVPESLTPIDQTTENVENATENTESEPVQESTESTPAEASATETPADDFISYETDPDAPPCPRNNPYARCVD